MIKDNIPVGTTIYFYFDGGTLGKGVVAGTGTDCWNRSCYKVDVYRPGLLSRADRCVPRNHVVATGYVPQFEMHWAYVRTSLWVRIKMIFYILTHLSINEGELLQPLWQQFLKEHS